MSWKCEGGCFRPLYMRGPYVNGPYGWGNGPYDRINGRANGPQLLGPEKVGPVYMQGPYVNGPYACGNGPYDFVQPVIKCEKIVEKKPCREKKQE